MILNISTIIPLCYAEVLRSYTFTFLVAYFLLSFNILNFLGILGEGVVK